MSRLVVNGFRQAGGDCGLLARVVGSGGWLLHAQQIVDRVDQKGLELFRGHSAESAASG